jgi:Tol biopolymer transport system component
MGRSDRPAYLMLIPFLLVACTTVPFALKRAPLIPATTPSPTVTKPTATTASDIALTGRFAYNTPDGNLWSVDVNGSHRVQLTHAGGNDFDPSWSPDGSQVVFRTSRGHYAPDRHGTGTEGIFIVAADGSAERQLYPIDPITPGGLFPDWSPDGTWIAFSGVHPDGSEAIYTIHPDGTGLSDLGSTNGSAECAEWSPDSTRIMFCSHLPGSNNFDVWVMNADGSHKTQMTTTPGRDYPGAWSPDGTQIAFSSERTPDGDSEVYVMNTDGSRMRRLTSMPGSQAPHVWLPGGWLVIDDWSTGTSLPAWHLIKADDGSMVADLPALAGGNSPIDWTPEEGSRR